MIPGEAAPAYDAPSMAAIRRAVCMHFGIAERSLLSNMNGRWVARPRQIAMYLARELTFQSYPQIGRHLGNRDHTTIMYGVRTIADLVRKDREVAASVNAIRDMLIGEERLAA
jgi:chromosomal replication initiator protein